MVRKSIDCGYGPDVHVVINNEISGSSKFSNQSSKKFKLEKACFISWVEFIFLNKFCKYTLEKHLFKSTLKVIIFLCRKKNSYQNEGTSATIQYKHIV